MKILKNGGLMVIGDDQGIIDSERECASGIYLEDTRFISKLSLKTSIFARRLYTVFSWDRVEAFFLVRIRPDVPYFDAGISEELRVTGNSILCLLKLKNFTLSEIQITINYDVRYVFEDIFSVRRQNDSYLGVKSFEALSAFSARNMHYESDVEKDVVQNSLPETTLDLKPGETATIPGKLHLKKIVKKCVVFKDMLQDRPVEKLKFVKTSRLFMDEDIADLSMLLIPTKFGDFPGAGLPWYATFFGRDSIIFGLQSLEFIPEMSRTIIIALSQLQSAEYDASREAEPGKVIHEARLNELSLSGRLPYESYYGSVDVTLLYVILVERYYEATADTDLINLLEDNIRAAAACIDEHADKDGDGYVEFTPSKGVLQVHGWKDSEDSVNFADGRTAEAPVALVEVQGYLYGAYTCLEKLMRFFSDEEKARDYARRARVLKEGFNCDFWIHDQKYVAAALDKHKTIVDSIASNPGHCLMTGIVDEERAGFVVKRLFSEELYTGWGIRTFSNKMKRYNPFSYHNGSVWPHDNSMIMLGLMRYGFLNEARKLAEDLLRARKNYRDKRLPEVFSGLSTFESSGRVVEYPASCSPQLWPLGTIFTISQALDA